MSDRLLQEIKHLSGLLLASTFLMARPAYAQDVDDAAPADQAKNDEGLGTIVVTARRRDEDLQETPLAATALAAETIEERNIQAVAEVTNFAPNIQFDNVASESGGGASSQISIRGIGQTDYVITVEPGVGLYLDGVFVGKSVGSLLDAVDVESIQVLRGPQGTLFGKNTIGGAVIVTTKRPSDAPEFYAELVTGNFDRLDGKIGFNLPVNDGLRIRGAGAILKRDGHVRRILDGGRQGSRDALTGRLTVELDVTPDLLATFSIDGTQTREESPGQVTVLIDENAFFAGLHNTIAFPACDPSIAGNTGRFTNPDCANSQYARDIDSLESTNTGPNQSDADVWGASLTLDYTGDLFGIKSISAYRNVAVDVLQELTGIPAYPNVIGNDLDFEQYSQELQLSYTSPDDRLNAIVGVFYLREEGDQVFPVLLESVQFTSGGNIKNDSYAVFGQATYELTDALNVTVGARYSIDEKSFLPDQQIDNVPDIFEPFFAGLAAATGNTFLVQEGLDLFPRVRVSTTDKEFTPSITLDYQFTDDVFGYVSFSQGFKGGGFTLRGFPPLIPGLTTTETDPNVLIPSFDPETATVYEVGLKTDLFDRRVRFNVSAFYTDYKDVQLTANAGPSAFVPVIINAGDATIWGIEGELEIAATDWLRLNAGAGYLNSSYDNLSDAAIAVGTTLDSDLPNSPKLSANGGFTADFFDDENGRLFLRGDLSYKSQQAKTVANDPVLIQDAYAIANASMTYQTPDQNWSITAGVTNITDEIFIVSGVANAGIGYAQAAVSRPREWFLKAKYQF